MSSPARWRQPSNVLNRATIRMLGVYAFIQGAGMVLGGPHRWAGPSFTVLRQVPHASVAWGYAGVLLGLAILVGSICRWNAVRLAGLFGLSAWSLSLGLSFLAATFFVPGAGTTGGPTYLLIALVAVPVMFVDETRDDYGPR